MASTNTANIRRCSLEKARTPTLPKNWLGRMTSAVKFLGTPGLMDSTAARKLIGSDSTLPERAREADPEGFGQNNSSRRLVLY